MSKGKFKKNQERRDEKDRLKTVDQPPSVSTNYLRPVFNLEYLAGKYCLSACTEAEKAAFADQIHRPSKMTWGNIQRAPRHGMGSETIDRGSLSIQAFPAELTEETRLLAF